MKQALRVVIFLTLGCNAVYGQNIPIGSWRTHVSYNSIRSIALGTTHTYAAGYNGVLIVDQEEKSITAISKLNGLHGDEITKLAYDESSEQLLIAYVDGSFDVVKNNRIRRFDPSLTTVITGSKKINGISMHDEFAYLNTDYGVLVYDLVREEIKETWRDIGEGGETLKIYQSVVLGDTIFLGSESGVMAGNINDNLLDFTKWKGFDDEAISEPIQHMAIFNGHVYIAVADDGVYRYANNTWTRQSYLENLMYTSLRSSEDHLIITAQSNIWLVDPDDQLIHITDDVLASPAEALEDAQGNIWIANNTTGMLKYSAGNFEAYLSDGPATSKAHRLRYHDNKMYLLPGGYTPSFDPALIPGVVSVFENGKWQVAHETVPDITDIAFMPSGIKHYSSFGYGVIGIDAEGNETRYDETNSPLVNSNPPERFVMVSALAQPANDLWVANYGVPESLHKLSADGTWESFQFPIGASQYPTALTLDLNNRIWMVLNPEFGGGIIVYDPEDGTHRYLTNQDNNGELPSRAVYAVTTDRDGYVWVGTDRGAAYFFDSSSDAVRPIMENIYLLLDDRVTAIAVDGGNRKWLGTQRGVWLVNPLGEESFLHFTSANSPLPSDNIVDIEIDPTTGEVFFVTDKGIVSYRSNATESKSHFKSVKIFPNPVRRNFSGEVGISGLATDAIVKITDVSGKLVWQGQANGGSASWHALDYNGKRVSTGVYLVFAATQDGRESMVGKLAVVD
ncbi:MAG TPA: two-component regulator propeller domain-containing protein [Ohtaekwangia sp.]|nr:two-component regulator propeller domain-containing protein [Ohtaekwangia sp.]